jgi:hypothetical protein
VIYRPPGWVGAAPAEEGVITEVRNNSLGGYVFVRYAGDAHSKATRPEDLRLLSEETTR